jgi:hypothetical protein
LSKFRAALDLARGPNADRAELLDRKGGSARSLKHYYCPNVSLF